MPSLRFERNVPGLRFERNAKSALRTQCQVCAPNATPSLRFERNVPSLRFERNVPSLRFERKSQACASSAMPSLRFERNAKSALRTQNRLRTERNAKSALRAQIACAYRPNTRRWSNALTATPVGFFLIPVYIFEKINKKKRFLKSGMHKYKLRSRPNCWSCRNDASFSDTAGCKFRNLSISRSYYSGSCSNSL